MRISIAPFYGLSLTAGCVDAISFVGFRGVFTANMTGNTVLLGIAIAARFGKIPVSLGIVAPLIAIATFILGAIVALPIFRAGFDARRAAAVVFAEAVLVGIASFAFSLLGGQYVVPLCIAMVSFSMGAQSIVAVRAGLPGIATTYVTGTLITAITRGLAPGASEQDRRKAAHDAWAWAAYLGGAIIGTLLLIALHHAALLIPAIILAALAALLYRYAVRHQCGA
ncbi:MAG: YoaK family protein [Candidatus Cybelea sp.]